jgi:CDGSH-type Zn-finger protein
MTADKKITIVKDGPYLVSGSIPLSESFMRTEGDHREYKPGRDLPENETYALCRCGHSKNPPFCDGTHVHIDFDGTETASTRLFDERAEVFEGPTLDLFDDSRCAFARFCHRAGSEVWTLTEDSDDSDARAEAILAAAECPAGRLVQHDKQDGYRELEPKFEPEIVLLQDPEKQCSGPLFIKGGIPLFSANGTQYELRNRYTLCRCGHSDNKPFCDAMHVGVKYHDGLDEK